MRAVARGARVRGQAFNTGWNGDQKERKEKKDTLSDVMKKRRVIGIRLERAVWNLPVPAHAYTHVQVLLSPP